MNFYNTEAERALLCAAINDRVARVCAMSRVLPKHICDEGHRAIYEALCALERRGASAQPDEIMGELKRNSTLELAGGMQGVYEIACDFPRVAGMDRFIDTVLRGYHQQKLIVAMRHSLASLEEQPAESLDELETHIAVLEEELRRDIPDDSELIDYRDCGVEEKQERGLLTGYADLDKHIDIRPGMVVTVYGDSGHKKTTFTMNMVAQWAKTNKIAVYNYEQRPSEVAKMVREADQYGAIPQGNLWLSPHPPMIEILPMQIKAIKARKGLDGVVVDYLQTVTTGNSKMADDENNLVRCAMRILRDMAISQDIWVVVVAQMRKTQGDTIEHQLNPSIDRMRGSGEIKMASSIVLSTVLPMKVGQEMFGDDSTEQMLVVHIKKNRDCLTGNPGEERAVKLVHQLDNRLITSWHSDAGLPSNRLPYKH